MSSTEKKAYEIMRELDVSYVLVIFGGLTGYSSDGEHLRPFTYILFTLWLLLLLLSTPLHQRAASRVQHPNHVAANSLSPQVARKGSTLSGFVQRSRLEREVGRDLHSNKWEEV